MKTEFNKDVTVGCLITLHDNLGVTVEINDGQIVGVSFEEEC